MRPFKTGNFGKDECCIFTLARQLPCIFCSRKNLKLKCFFAQLLASGDCSGTLDVIDDLQLLLVSVTILQHST